MLLRGFTQSLVPKQNLCDKGTYLLTYVRYRPDTVPVTEPTASKHCRQLTAPTPTTEAHPLRPYPCSASRISWEGYVELVLCTTVLTRHLHDAGSWYKGKR